jgi:membrane protein YqaA with SNARE-associated domain
MSWFNVVIEQITNFLSLPEYALPVLFLWCMASATVLPLGSEVMVLSYVNVNPDKVTLTLVLATLGNTLGGMINYYVAFTAQKMAAHTKLAVQSPNTLRWLEKMGAKMLFFSFIPIIGDPLTLLAGWLKLPWLPCLLWQAAGKLIRYAAVLILAQYVTAWF